jgi:hypothetical protein
MDRAGNILHIREVSCVDTYHSRLPIISVVRRNFRGDAKLIVGSGSSNDSPDSIHFIGLTEYHPLDMD